ncbi:hypothetical protein F5880DRAFT_1512464 [Lentinula raphanica]|nr:hypothetical protein F5880DRAFT_1512464 [Lentinula raphanica]
MAALAEDTSRFAIQTRVALVKLQKLFVSGTFFNCFPLVGQLRILPTLSAFKFQHYQNIERNSHQRFPVRCWIPSTISDVGLVGFMFDGHRFRTPCLCVLGLGTGQAHLCDILLDMISGTPEILTGDSIDLELGVEILAGDRDTDVRSWVKVYVANKRVVISTKSLRPNGVLNEADKSFSILRKIFKETKTLSAGVEYEGGFPKEDVGQGGEKIPDGIASSHSVAMMVSSVPIDDYFGVMSFPSTEMDCGEAPPVLMRRSEPVRALEPGASADNMEGAPKQKEGFVRSKILELRSPAANACFAASEFDPREDVQVKGNVGALMFEDVLGVVSGVKTEVGPKESFIIFLDSGGIDLPTWEGGGTATDSL